MGCTILNAERRQGERAGNRVIAQPLSPMPPQKLQARNALHHAVWVPKGPNKPARVKRGTSAGPGNRQRNVKGPTGRDNARLPADPARQSQTYLSSMLIPCARHRARISSWNEILLCRCSCPATYSRAYARFA